MYHEERVIDGVLCWRGTPTGQWHEFTPAQLTAMYLTRCMTAAVIPALCDIASTAHREPDAL